MRVTEAISMFQEVDLLEAHLEESQHWADRIVIIESPVTFSGQKKRLYFKENEDRFKRFNVEHLVTPPGAFKRIPFDYPPEDNERYYKARRWNRNQNRHLHWDYLRDGVDYVYLNDVDEFVDHTKWPIVQKLLEPKDLLYLAIATRRYNFYVNYKGGHQEQYRITRADLEDFEVKKGTKRGSTQEEVGWHFTNCFFPEDLRLKILGICCHGNTPPSQIPTVEEITDRLNQGIEPWVQNKLGGTILPKDKDLSWAPKFIRENPDLFPWKT